MKNRIEFCNDKLQPQIYVACLAAYNNGYLHGKWIDASQDVDDLYAEIKTMLAASPIANAEEFAIHDYQGFGDICIHEYESLERVSEIANFVVEHDGLGTAVLAHTNGDIDEARGLLDGNYYGEYDSETDFAEQYAEDTMQIPKHLEYYIDYEKLARDLFINDFFSIEVNHVTHVFSYL